MNKILYYLSICLIAVLFTSCMSMQCHSYVVLNPDMSGKCTYDIKMGKDMAGILTMPKEDLASGFGMGLSGGAKKDNKDVALALASKLLSSGTIDAWKDVQFGYLKKDTVFFKGTAYFKDITKMAVSMFDSTLKVSKDGDGNIVIEMDDRKQKKKDTTLSWTNHSYDSITNSIYKGTGLSDLMHYYYACMVKDLYVSASYQLPGKIISASNFIRKDDHTVILTITGEGVIKLIDTMANSNNMGGDVYSKYLSSTMGTPGSQQSMMGTEDDPYAFNKILYGEDKPVKVVFKPDNKPVFDYVKEMTEAKKQYKQFRITSGLEKYDSLQAIATKEEEEEKAKEEGTLVLTAADSVNHKMYLKTLKAKQYGEYMSFSGTLSRPVKDNYSTKVQITKAVTDNGVNITDSLNKGSSSYFDIYDSGSSKSNITAYLSSSNYSSYMDTNASYDLVSFNVYGHFPDGTKYVNIEGVVEIDMDTKVPFKIVKLYPKKSDYDYTKWK